MRGGACLDLHVKYMGIRKTHFPCRKTFGAIRLSHFSRIRLCRVSHSLPGVTTAERLRPTSFNFIAYTHIQTSSQLQKLRSIRSIRYVFKAFVGHLGRPFIFLRISNHQRICLFRCAMRDSITPVKKKTTSSAYSCLKITIGKKRNEVRRCLWISTTLLRWLRTNTRNPLESVGFEMPVL